MIMLDGKSPVNMRTLLVATVVAVGLIVLAYFTPVLAQSEQPTSLKNVIMSIYPEYDDPLQLGYPAILVMFEGEVISVNLPTTIRFLIPADAVMYSAGSGPRNQYVGGPPNRKSSEIVGWDEISYELQTNYFVIEYYSPISGQPDRIIQYDFHPLYTINGLTAIVQEPKRSTNFMVSPQGSFGTDSEGFRVHTYSYTNVSPDKPLHFDIKYTRTDSKPSLVNNSVNGSSNMNTVIVVIVTIVLLVGAFMLLSKLRRKSQLATTRAERRRATRASRSSQVSKAKYCRKCGKPIESIDYFCRHCGNELR